ncbi:MAG: ABC transporter ATP-binding protein [Desulfobacteraceae bacterium]|nr:MAG: ABC transporter ATP-binding protein [Desulfobacteraceae bacterium]
MVATNQKTAVEFKGVAKVAYSKKTHAVILQDCSFNVEAGRLTVLIGPSGCGKTTVINLIAGYERPDRGEVLVNGQPVSGPNWERLVLFQEMALFPWLTCYENVMFGPIAHRSVSREEAHKEALKLLNKVGLSDFRDKYPSQLSGGMQRRAELARALINKPKVMLMDEPFRGLDAMTRKLMQEYYLKLFEEIRATHVFVTSELEEAIILADNLLVMTNKPSKVKKVIDVDLSRPRDWSMAASKKYLEIKAEALELLHEEAVKASAASGKVDVDLTGLLRKADAG